MSSPTSGVNNAEWAMFPVGVTHTGINAAKNLYENHSLFGGGGSGPSYDESWFAQRTAQINKYALDLNSARASYLSSLGNMYNDAYTRFNNNLQPGFANRGLGVDSGAFAQALAYKSSEYSAQLAPEAYKAQREDLNNIDKARGNMWSTEIGARTGSRDLAYKEDQENSRALGGFAMNAGLALATGGASVPVQAGMAGMNNYNSYGGQPTGNKLDLYGRRY